MSGGLRGENMMKIERLRQQQMAAAARSDHQGMEERFSLQSDLILRETIGHSQSPMMWTIPVGVDVIVFDVIGAGGGGGARGNHASVLGGTYWRGGTGGGGGQSGARVVFRFRKSLYPETTELYIEVGEGGAGGVWEEGESPTDGADGGQSIVSFEEDEEFPMCRAIGGQGGRSGGTTPGVNNAGAGGARNDTHLIESGASDGLVTYPVFGQHGQQGPLYDGEPESHLGHGWGGNGGQLAEAGGTGSGGRGDPFPHPLSGIPSTSGVGLDGGNGVVRIYY